MLRIEYIWGWFMVYFSWYTLKVTGGLYDKNGNVRPLFDNWAADYLGHSYHTSFADFKIEGS